MKKISLKTIKTLIIILAVIIVVVMVMVEGCQKKNQVKPSQESPTKVVVNESVPEPLPEVKPTQNNIDVRKSIIGKWLLISMKSGDQSFEFKDPSKIKTEQKIVYNFTSNLMEVSYFGKTTKMEYKWITKDTFETIFDKSQTEFLYARELSRFKIVDNKLYMNTKDTAGQEVSSIFLRIEQDLPVKNQDRTNKIQ